MFTAKELQNIDAGYFSVIASGGCALTLQSKNTGHCWHILLEEYPSFRSCRIYHTHQKGSPYHEHAHGASLYGCLRQIKAHDRYWLGKRKASRKYTTDHQAENRQEVRL